MLFISCKQCYLPSIGIGQILAILCRKSIGNSVLDRLVKTGIGASLIGIDNATMFQVACLIRLYQSSWIGSLLVYIAIMPNNKEG